MFDGRANGHMATPWQAEQAYARMTGSCKLLSQHRMLMRERCKHNLNTSIA